MAKIKVLLEIDGGSAESFTTFEAAQASDTARYQQMANALDSVAGLGVELDEQAMPVPMFSGLGREGVADIQEELSTFATPTVNSDLPARSTVVPVEVDPRNLEELHDREGVRVWANSELTLYPLDRSLFGAVPAGADDGEVLDLARSRKGVDCRPFRPGVDLSTIRRMLGVEAAWDDGFRGQNITVGIIDEGVDGTVYPVSGGFARSGAHQPGTAAITSHGSMCAADVLVAAPAARLYDYPFLGVPNSGGALTMFQAVLDQRRLDGTPQLLNNSWGFMSVPPQANAPNSEIWAIDHPLHRKVREVVASGATVFFAAGNCGADCPSGRCHISSIGPGTSIHGSSSLVEVITIAAVNSRHERIGYSSQGPGMFAREKPDLAAYSHLFANFGPGRPGGTEQPFDNGTSAATPVAVGVAAVLLSAYPDLKTGELWEALIEGATRVVAQDWDPDYGRGIINAAASYTWLRRRR